ncbi:hypothetical protein EVA_20850, partial [gut metagenome]
MVWKNRELLVGVALVAEGIIQFLQCSLDADCLSDRIARNAEVEIVGEERSELQSE